MCTHCLDKRDDAWLDAPLRPLLMCGAASACAELLVPALCERRALEPLGLYLQHAPALSDTHLVAVLELTLDERQKAAGHARAAKEAAAAQASAPRKAKKLVPFGAKAPSAAEDAEAAAAVAAEAAEDAQGWDKLLDRLIGAPRNDIFLLQALRSLPLDAALSLLQRLLALLSRYFAEAAAAAVAAAGSGDAAGGAAGGEAGAPSLAQIVGWLNVLIDAHFARFLMHAPCHPLVERLNGLARRHVKACASLKTLKGYLKQASLRSAQPAAPVAQYSVEALDL